MYWLLAMFFVVPFLRGRAMVRTWLALLLASGAAWVFPNIAAFIAIDLIAAAVVIKHPAGWSQRLICLCFIGMIIVEAGHVVSPNMGGAFVAYAGLFLGWIQWALLIVWSLHESLGRNSSGDSTTRRSLASGGDV